MRIRFCSIAGLGLALAACSAGSATAPAAAVSRNGLTNGLTFEATSEVAPAAPVPAVRTTVTVRNTAAQPVTVEEGGCIVQIKLYREAGRTGAPAWNQGVTQNCTAALRYRTFQPGEDATYRAVARLAELREAGLAPGRYYVTAMVDLSLRGPALVLSAGEVELPGG